MPVNGCHSSHRGANWSGFSNDAISSFRLNGGCCRFYKERDCIGGPMFTACTTNVPSIGSKYGDQFNDVLSSVYCYL